MAHPYTYIQERKEIGKNTGRGGRKGIIRTGE
jgi:hypothetical protein